MFPVQHAWGTLTRVHARPLAAIMNPRLPLDSPSYLSFQLQRGAFTMIHAVALISLMCTLLPREQTPSEHECSALSHARTPPPLLGLAQLLCSECTQSHCVLRTFLCEHFCAKRFPSCGRRAMFRLSPRQTGRKASTPTIFSSPRGMEA